MKSVAISSRAMSLRDQGSETPVTDAPLRFVAPDAAHERPNSPSVHLTTRQLEVLSLLCEGLPNKLICRQLNIATGTVKVHIGCILRELGVSSRLQAVVAARRNGLVRESSRTPGRAADSSIAGQAASAAGAPEYRNSYRLAVAF